jgi:hypothetical protein
MEMQFETRNPFFLHFKPGYGLLLSGIASFTGEVEEIAFVDWIEIRMPIQLSGFQMYAQEVTPQITKYIFESDGKEFWVLASSVNLRMSL